MEDNLLREEYEENQEYSDDNRMQRRAPIRRKSALDDDQTSQAMKLLEKYIRKKYRHSVIFSQDSADIEQSSTPVGHTQSACQFSRNLTPEQRNGFYSTPLGPAPSEYHFPPGSPQFRESTIREEFKQQYRETWGHWFVRVGKFLYKLLGIQYMLLALMILGYACLGGYIFLTLEYDQQQLDLEVEKQVRLSESTLLAENLLKYLKQWNCGQSNENRCLELITKAFIERSIKVERDIRGEGWRWDFWNSVFFSATIFTTIGYGNLACKTNLGRVATIIYGLIGIPLMLFVLKIFGEHSIKWAQKVRYSIRRCVKRCFRRSKLKRASTIESVASDEMPCEESGISEDEEQITTFPVKWALFIVFFFMVVCSLIVSFWEKWDFLTAFYFFFVSLSTIGFGDVIPEHPRTACALFVLYFVGLALFSMVYAILQERVENQYMWALELIDQEYQENQKQDPDDHLEIPTILPENAAGMEGWTNTIGKMVSQNPVRWRAKNSAYSMENMPDRPISERRFSVLSPGEAPQAPPPVLGTFMLHSLSVKKKLLARSESILNRTGTKRPSTLFPSNEMLSTSASSSRGSPWPHAAEMNRPKEATRLGEPSALRVSAPNLTISGGNRSPSGGALSVITEASDEDTRHFKKHRRPLAKTVSTDGTVSNHGSAESLDQVMDELQLESHDQAVTPKPYRDPTTSTRFRKRDETVVSRAEKMPLSPNEVLEEEDEDENGDT
ncbi:Potassium channel domain-containing protein [Caenorhabditis elegans]|uniref:Potassium channel domain-containing protein n=1 Tax=Caenorhabditis elegans TaxID=6239 RepID=A6ZJ65_CAEEL|nr:Potassium channel domain-containing protein [Caenorhabditis elegans]CAO78724.2 Potassium channel domain-containing protein [Caenorhabditis elegans]